MIADDKDAEYLSTLVAIERHYIKLEVDKWLIKYDKWLTKRARVAEKQWNLRGIWEDLKSEMVLAAYEIAKRFDLNRGNDLNKFLRCSLWYYGSKPEVISKFKRNDRETMTFNCSGDAANGVEHDVACNWEISSLERSANVFSLLSQLQEHDRLLVSIKYQMGFTDAELDKLLGVGQTVTAYRLRKAIDNIKVSGDVNQ